MDYKLQDRSLRGQVLTEKKLCFKCELGRSNPERKRQLLPISPIFSIFLQQQKMCVKLATPIQGQKKLLTTENTSKI